MAAKKPIDPSTLGTNWSLQRVLKPRGKLYPGPYLGPKGNWRAQLFMDSVGCLYERHRTMAYEKAVERWFAITSFEATATEPLRLDDGSVARDEKQSRSERAAEKRRLTEMELRFSLHVLFGDLVDELGFAITEGLFDDEGRRLLRRVIKRVVDARSIFYDIGQPQPPPKLVEYSPPIIEPTRKTIH